MGNAAPQAAAIGSLSHPASPCKGLSEANSFVVLVSLSPETTSLALPAAINLRYTSLEPERPTLVVIDSECVEQRPLGATAWSKVEGRENDEIRENDDTATDKSFEKKSVGDEALKRMIDGVARNSKFLDERPGSLGVNR